MGDNRFSCGQPGPGGQREMVSIETNRILDSCRDRDCFEDVRVFLTDFGNDILDRTTNIRAKSACIAWTYIGIDPVPFNRGFYSVTIKFFIKINFEACVCGGRSQEFDGIVVVEKKVILFGSESNVSIYKSNPDASDYCSCPQPCSEGKNVPIAIVEVVDPILLNTKVREACDPSPCCCCCCCDDVPEIVSSRLSGPLNDNQGRYITVSLGIFSVVRIVRPAQYLIQATEYCVPDKECITPEDDNPCTLFRTMAFPTSEFCPPNYVPPHGDRGSGKCGC